MENRIDFANENFFSGQNVFVELHVALEGQLEKATARLRELQDFKKWPFPVKRLAYILHDKDTDVNGELKPAHFHILIVSGNKTGKKQWITCLSQVFQCDPLQVSLSSVRSERGCLRYMVHRTDESKDKYQYPLEDCWQSHARMLEEALAPKKNDDPSWEEMLEITSLKELYEMVGLRMFGPAAKAWEIINAEARRKDEKDFLEAQIDGLNEELKDNLNDWKRLQEIFRNYLAENGTLYGPMKEILDIVYARIQKTERN